MNPISTVIDSVVRAPIVDSEEYDGVVTYESPRLRGSYSGYIKASLKGVHGGYTANDRPLLEPLDSYVQKDEDRGNLVPDDQQATITVTGSPSYTAQSVSEVSSSRRMSGTAVDLTFNAFTLGISYSQQPITYWRYLFVDADIPVHRAFQGQFRQRTTVVAQGYKTNDRSFIVAVHDGQRLNEIEERSLWLAIIFLCGTKAGNYLLEGYDATGSLVSREFRAGHEQLPAVTILFNVHVMPPSNFIDVFANGFYNALMDGFPVDVILEQLFDSANSVLDFTLQNCLLSIHSAFEAWHKIQPPNIDADKKWLSDNKARLFTALDDLVKTAPERVRSALSYGINNAANFGTGEKERRFFADWGIDVSDPDKKKALALRNGLLHDGYFNRRFADIDPAEKQFRVNAIGILKNLIALILFRTIGYPGQFISQRDYMTQLTAVQGEAIFPLGAR